MEIKNITSVNQVNKYTDVALNHFNAFYKPYLRALKVTNIYRNQFKRNSFLFNILYCMIFILLMICIFWTANTKHYFVSLTAYMTCVFALYLSDNKALKNCIKQLRKKHKIKFLTLSPLEQVKYYLWKEELLTRSSSFSINKALRYLDIELTKYYTEKMPAEYLLVLSGVSLIAFWRLFDDIHLIGQYKIILDVGIFYISYRYIVFKCYLFSSKKKKLLEFKQNLLRLKSEFL